MSEKTGSVISQACTIRLERADHLNAYSLPKVAASRTLQLDSYLNTEIQPVTKATEKESATVQSRKLDAFAPLTGSAILETREDIPEKIVNAATDTVKLLGNGSARICHLWCTKISPR